jgi:Lar family restriction alleviation protein
MTPLPCPFCGSTNGTYEQGETYRWILWTCAECGAKGPAVRCNITGSGTGGMKEARMLAVEAWNKRTAPGGKP